jgi:hypothetical protein
LQFQQHSALLFARITSRVLFSCLVLDCLLSLDQPSQNTELFAGQIVTMGFSGTYTDDGAEITATALAGKRSVGLKVMFERLKQD